MTKIKIYDLLRDLPNLTTGEILEMGNTFMICGMVQDEEYDFSMEDCRIAHSLCAYELIRRGADPNDFIEWEDNI